MIVADVAAVVKGAGEAKKKRRFKFFLELIYALWNGEAKGWPVGSGAVESACDQLGHREKHASMRWRLKAADALQVVKAAILSGDGRWEKRWPVPIPEMNPAPSTMAA